jgi:endonuclease/exonuclease/phosphatase family metal-dependent hydrolase
MLHLAALQAMTLHPLARFLLLFTISAFGVSVLRIVAQDVFHETTEIECEGTYGGHLQGVVSDGKSLYWSHTVQLVKTDLKGQQKIRIDVPDHHGDLTFQEGKLFVAVELGAFNREAGAADPWVYIYDAATLTLLKRHRVPELIHGCGGIASNGSSFVLVGGLPGNHPQNYVFEYDTNFQFLRRHVLFSGQTRLGIQTAAYFDAHWWFGCYGAPGNPGLLKVNTDFNLVGQSPVDFSYGIAALNETTWMRGQCFESNTRGKVTFVQGKGIPATKPVAVTVRMAAYNVLFGLWTEPEVVGEMFQPYHLDLIAFSEVPSKGWTERVGRVLGMPYAYVGTVSSANHQDKYKSILSRTALEHGHEIEVTAEGWSPASLVGCDTRVRGVELRLYATHIPGRSVATGSAAAFIAGSVLREAVSKHQNVVLLGDLNNVPGDPALHSIEASGMRSMWSDLQLNTARLSTHRHIESGTESGVIDHIHYSEISGARAIQGGILYRAHHHPYTERQMSRYEAAWRAYGKPLSDHRPIWAVLEYPSSHSD